MKKRFRPAELAAFETTKYLYIRSGNHRYVPIWVVVLDGRVVVRSWNDKPEGWYRAFLRQPAGHVRLEDREVKIRAVPVRSKAIIEGMQDAYARKYTTKGNARYVSGFGTERRKMATLELLPA